jgi:FkbM family methyltransferase
MIKNDLIIDVGMHRGEDTSYYLKKGYNVIAIDADPNTIKYVNQKFSREVELKKLKILNYAIADIDDLQMDFNISELSLWSSLKKEIADRNHLAKDTVKVECKTLKTIFKTYGIPYYCKIDIEGYDELCLQTLAGSNILPTFISVESECVGENEVLRDEQALGTLNRLKELGYSKFKLVDQTSLEVLKKGEDFYSHAKMLKFRKPSLKTKIINKISKVLGIGTYTTSHRELLNKKFNHNFFIGSSGPFGNDLDGEWLDYDSARACLLKHRNDYFKLQNSISYGFWCDWHATK